MQTLPNTAISKAGDRQLQLTPPSTGAKPVPLKLAMSPLVAATRGGAIHDQRRHPGYRWISCGIRRLHEVVADCPRHRAEYGSR